MMKSKKLNDRTTRFEELERREVFAAPAGVLPGDLDANGTVEMADFVILGDHFGKSGAPRDGDLNGSQMIDFQDFLILADRFGESNPLIQDQAKLRTITIASLNYESANNGFPSRPILASDGTPLLSWRVRILPYLGQQALYDQFRLNEPWNSPHNQGLLNQMPDVFRSVSDPAGTTETRFQLLDGPNTAAERSRSRDLKFGEITDGPGNTIWAVQSGQDRRVPWTRPESLSFDPANVWQSLGYGENSRMNVSFLDGTASSVTTNTSSNELSALSTVSSAAASRDPQEWRDAASLLVRENDFTVRPGDQAKLHSITWASLQYESANSRFPSHPIVGQDGTPLLSWRVKVLPFLGLQALYDQFHLDEPWDSAHNRELIPLMPDVFRSITDSVQETSTRFQLLDGPNTVADGTPATAGRRLSEIKDGSSNTIWGVQSGPDKKALWTQPASLSFDPARAWESLGYPTGSRMNLSLVDGTVSSVSTQTSTAELSALSTISAPSASSNPLEWVDARSLLVRENGPEARQDDQHRSVTLAFLNYEEHRSYYPKNYWGNPDPTQLVSNSSTLSWRVGLLPYLGLQNLFSQFRLDEPWNSPHNLSLLPYMPDVYRGEGDDWNSTDARILSFVGENTIIDASGKKVGPRDLQGAMSQTAILVEVGHGVRVPWTKPDDIAGVDAWWRKLGLADDMARFSFADGSFRTVRPEGIRISLKS